MARYCIYTIALFFLLARAASAAPLDLRLTPEFSLADADVTFTGTQPQATGFYGERAGRTVAIIPDINNDGYDDILIAGTRYSGTALYQGRVYLFYGKPDGWEADINLALADAIFTHHVENTQFGFSLAGLGDVNGDGYNDFAIGTLWRPQAADTDRRGRVYVYFGGPQRYSGLVPATSADLTLIAKTTSDGFGTSLSGNGDINGDGIADLILGEGAARRVSVFLGQRGLEGSWEPAATYRTRSNKRNSNDVGKHLSLQGDFNGDGLDDLVFDINKSGQHTSPRPEHQADRSRVYIIPGHPYDWAAPSVVHSEALASFIDVNTPYVTWNEIATVGDVNGDGISDFIVGSPNGNTRGGSASLVFGRKSGWGHDLMLREEGVYFENGLNFDYPLLGGTTYLGDINGDGLDDVLLTAHGYFAGWPWVGKTFIFLGRKEWRSRYSVDEADYIISGDSSDPGDAGISVSTGDVNGDGVPDLLFGAVTAANYRGKAYLHFSALNTPPTRLSRLTAWQDASHKTPLGGTVGPDQELWLLLEGDDPDPTTGNLARVRVTSDADPRGVVLNLVEREVPGLATSWSGRLRTTWYGSNPKSRRIRVRPGGTLTVTSVEDGNVQLVVPVRNEAAPVPRPAYYRKPRIALGGYWRTRLSATDYRNDRWYMYFIMNPDDYEATSKINIYAYGNQVTGWYSYIGRHIEDNFLLYTHQHATLRLPEQSKFLIEYEAVDVLGRVSNRWPFLTVEE